MKLNRRDLFAVAGGAVAGTILSPAPWKLIDDLSIWTQNWSWIPVPPKGPVTMKPTICALCPQGCAVSARCVGGLPVSLHPVAGDAVSGGSLCPLGLTGHHLPYHPSRLQRPVRLIGERGSRRAVPVPVENVVGEVAGAIRTANRRGGRVAVLDLRPGRSQSQVWRQLVSQCRDGVVIPAPGREGCSLESARALIHCQGGDPALGLANATTVFSFGAPIAEGWGRPALMKKILEGRTRLIHTDAVHSPTAALADRWIPLRPGTEGTLALGLAHLVHARGLTDQAVLRASPDFEEWLDLQSCFGPLTVAERTGVPVQMLNDIVEGLRGSACTVVVPGEDPGGGRLGCTSETAVLSLNVLLGSVCRPGGLTFRRPIPQPFEPSAEGRTAELHDLEDASISVLIVDGSAGDTTFPWSMVEKKLHQHALVLALSPWLAGTACQARLVLPALPFLEAPFELPAPPLEPAAGLAIAAPLLPPREPSHDVASFARSLAVAAGVDAGASPQSTEALLRMRVERIHAAGRGTVTTPDGTVTPLGEMAAVDSLWAALLAGGRWTDEEESLQPSAIRLLGGRGAAFRNLLQQTDRRSAEEVTLVAHASRDMSASAAISPAYTKICQESGLRAETGTAAVNPATAVALRLSNGRSARLQTAQGTTRVRVRTDEAVMPGVVALQTGAEVVTEPCGSRPHDRRAVDLCSGNAEGVWRSSRARLTEES